MVKFKHKVVVVVVFGMMLNLALGWLLLGSPVGAEDFKDGPPRPEVVVVKLYFETVAQRNALAVRWGASEVGTDKGYLTVWASAEEHKQMLADGLKVEVDQPMSEQANALTEGGGTDTFYGGYRTVAEMQSFLDQQVASYPTLAEKVDFGNSWCKDNPGSCTRPTANNGYDLWAMRITNRSIAGPKPVFWYDGGIHSREIAVPEVAMRYISYLLDNYNTNADARWLVDYHDIYVVPMLNPDGHRIVEAGGSSPYYQRKNADNNDGCTRWPPSSSSQFGTDLNRNFPYGWGQYGGSSGSSCSQTYRGPSAGSEVETQYAMNKIRSLIADQRGPNASDPAPLTTSGIVQSMHAYAGMNLFPWGWGSTGSPNDTDMRNIGAHMSASNAGGNGYSYGRPPELLYAVDGDNGSWVYGELGVPVYTTELGPSNAGFFPSYSTVDARFNENRGMLLYMAKIARTPYLTTRGPDANVSVGAISAPQGGNASLSATINYAWSNNAYSQNVAAAEYYIDTPPWAGGTARAMTASDGSFNSATEGATASVSTAGLSVGRHIIFLRGRGVNSYSGNLSWGPVTAVWLDVTASAGAADSK